MSNLELFIGTRGASDLRAIDQKRPIVSASLKSQITTFNREKPATTADVKSAGDLERIKKEVTSAIDQLELAITEILRSRAVDEVQARRWIMIAGIVIVLLLVASAIFPFVTTGTSWLTTLMSGISVTGLVYLLFSPVNKLIEISRERAGLIILPSTFRIRVLAATSKTELLAITKDLFELLQRPIVSTTSEVQPTPTPQKKED